MSNLPERKRQTMSNFPEEMLQEIFIRLPVKSILRFKSVSKALCSLIRSRSFINMHHNLTGNVENNTSFLLGKRESMYSIDHSLISSLLPLSTSSSSSSPPIVCECDESINRIDYPFKPQANYSVDISKKKNYSVDFIYSCNGLLCICFSTGGDNHKDELYLWNPLTKEYKKIPPAPQKTLRRLDLGVYGFGYDNNTDTYKLIRVIDFKGDSDSSEVDIYTLGSNSWRSIQNIPYYFKYEYDYYQGVLYNGALHWPAITIGEHSMVLISFGIENESFGEVALPEKPMPYPEEPLEDRYSICVGVLGGCLCLLFHVYHVRIDVWIMQDYGVRESWTQSFSITLESLTATNYYYLPSFWSLKKEVILMRGVKSLFVYDPKTKGFKELMLPDRQENSKMVVGGNYVPRLVFLD